MEMTPSVVVVGESRGYGQFGEPVSVRGPFESDDAAHEWAEAYIHPGINFVVLPLERA